MMKKVLGVCALFALLSAAAYGCAKQPETPRELPLSIPVLSLQGDTFSWQRVDNAVGYVVRADGVEQTVTDALSFAVPDAQSDCVVSVKAVAAKAAGFCDSGYSDEVRYCAPTVLPPPDIAVGETSFVYNGKGQAPVAGADGLSLNAAYSADGGSTYTAAQPVNAGSYKARFEFSGNSDFAAHTREADFVILPRPLSVAEGNADKAYDGNRAVTASVQPVGVVAGDEVTLTGSYADKNAAENIAIVYAADNANYTVEGSYAGRITPKKLSVMWQAEGLVYNGGAQQPAASCETGIAGESVPLVVVTPSPCIDAGAYLATASAVAPDPNYTLDNTTCDFTIEKFTIDADRFVFADKTVFYDGDQHFLTVENCPPQILVTYDCLGSEFFGASEIDSYAITATITIKEEYASNYTCTSVSLFAVLHIVEPDYE